MILSTSPIEKDHRIKNTSHQQHNLLDSRENENSTLEMMMSFDSASNYGVDLVHPMQFQVQENALVNVQQSLRYANDGWLELLEPTPIREEEKHDEVQESHKIHYQQHKAKSLDATNKKTTQDITMHGYSDRNEGRANIKNFHTKSGDNHTCRRKGLRANSGHLFPMDWYSDHDLSGTRGSSHPATAATPKFSSDDCIKPQEHDVICTRGKRFYQHAGCIRFREIIQEFHGKYKKAKTRLDKTIVIDSVIACVTMTEQLRRGDRIKGVARFLKYDVSSKTFKIMDNAHVRDKVGHALRDAA